MVRLSVDPLPQTLLYDSFEISNDNQRIVLSSFLETGLISHKFNSYSASHDN